MKGLIQVKCDGVPLNTGKNNRVLLLNARKNMVFKDQVVIDAQDSKADNPAVVDVEINTNLSILFSKKLKCIFVFNFLLALVSIVLSLAFGYLYWIQMEYLQEQLIYLKMKNETISVPRSYHEPVQQPLYAQPEIIGSHNPAFEAHNFGTHDIIPKIETGSQNIQNLTLFQKDLLIVQFNGAQHEVNLGSESIIGPWARDLKVSSPNSHTKIDLERNHVTIREGGLYLIYAQVVYLTHEPSCYIIWARHGANKPRMLTACSSGGSSNRPLSQSQISCSVQTLVRLYEDDVVNIAQREKNRTLWLRPGYSYFGFIKLSS
ncbi:uncharacterized protein ACR2FA_011302 [Aphomia sociella]